MSSREAANINFEVIGLTLLGIKLSDNRSYLEDVLSTRPTDWFFTGHVVSRKLMRPIFKLRSANEKERSS